MKLVILFSLLIFAVQSDAAIYKWVDENGIVHFSQNENDAPKNADVKEVKVHQANVSQAPKNTNIPSIAKTKQLSTAELDRKCSKLGNIAARNPNGFKSPEYAEYVRIGCTSSSRLRRIFN